MSPFLWNRRIDIIDIIEKLNQNSRNYPIKIPKKDGFLSFPTLGILMKIRKLAETDLEHYQRICRYAFEPNLNNYEKMEFPVKKWPLEWWYGPFTWEDKMMASGFWKY